MILYTMMPQELIYPQTETEDNQFKYINVNGVSLAVSPSQSGEYTIERVMSTNPQHFLDGRYSPGQKIRF
ncbi:YlzJ-like family protein [Bacillus sp. REN16]|uniref:YlzJ-like family protein n=1 Tax=Bacillus sp. REN16 TaxID=2887296 RepID=UPI001E64CD8F|nr:YlzJ-like family protein [Bacillus sp. REN16]MCC3357414.1 YlzJ-like family protein [Bacillus sp. REN16]